MDRRTLLLDQLVDARQRVINSKDRIEHHKQSIAEQQRAGQVTAMARELLEMTVDTHAAQVATLNRLRIQLSQL